MDESAANPVTTPATVIAMSKSSNTPRQIAFTTLIPGVILCLALGLLASNSPAQKTPSHATKNTPRVEIAQASEQTLAIHHRLTGVLVARRRVQLSSQEEGQVLSVHGFEGDAVKQGQVLATLDDRLLQAELHKATASVEQAKLDLARLTKLRLSKLSSEDELARARTTLKLTQAEALVLRTRIGHTRISAPFDAIISQRLVNPFDSVARHRELFTLFDPQSLAIQVRVTPWLLAQLKKGDTLHVDLQPAATQRPHRLIEARLTRLFPEIGQDSHRGRFEASLAAIPTNARPGQRVQVQLQTDLRKRLLIPLKALRHQQTAGKNSAWVYRLDQTNTIHKTPVTSGQSFPSNAESNADLSVEILSGLQPGARVVTRGFLGLRDGQTVRYQ